jgi:hypothetical protein
LIEFILGWVVGLLTLIGYGAFRALGDDGWDDSNLLNWIRLLSHVVMHPSDFGKMVYAGTDERPFWYLSEDEFQGVVKSRPAKK